MRVRRVWTCWMGWILAAVAGVVEIRASQVTNPCIGRPTTQRTEPHLFAAVSARMERGRILFDYTHQGFDGKITWKDGCGNQTEDPIPLGDVTGIFWIESPGGYTYRDRECPILLPGEYFGNYQVESSTGQFFHARKTVVIPHPDWAWRQPPSLYLQAEDNYETVEVHPYRAHYDLSAFLIPGVRYDRRGNFSDEAYPPEDKARMEHFWRLVQYDRPPPGDDVAEISHGTGLEISGTAVDPGKLQIQVTSILETQEPPWHHEIESRIMAAHVSAVTMDIRGTVSTVDDVVVATPVVEHRGLNSEAAVELHFHMPEGLGQSRYFVNLGMAPGSVGEMRWETGFFSVFSGESVVVKGWCIKPGIPGRKDRIAARIQHPSFSEVVFKDIQLLPVSFNGDAICMLGGHPNDTIELCSVPGIACEWRFLNESPNLGELDAPHDSKCSFRARRSGVNWIQMWIGETMIWEKTIEVFPIISREAWGALDPLPHRETMDNFQHLTLHHSSNTASGVGEIRRIQRVHMSKFPYNIFGGKDFYDIGYHFLVDKEGRLFEGRRLESAPGAPFGPYTKGEHVGSNNTVAGLGFCTMGDFESTEGNERLSDIQQIRIERILAALCIRYRIAPEQISYHRELSVGKPSLCPGSNFIPRIPEITRRVRSYLQ